MSTDDKQTDNELKAYLDGKDGVSAAYRKTAREEPPAALDHAILKAARAAQGKQAASGKEPSVVFPYALAASVMVTVLAGTMYYTQLENVVEIPVSATTVRLESARELQYTENAETESVEADDEASEALALPRAQFETRQLAPAAPPVGVADLVEQATLQDAGTADAFARVAEAPLVVIDGPLLEQIEAEAAQADVVRQVAAQGQAGAGGQLEEVTVTGSRISRDERDLSYRDSREDWLEQIRAMTEDLQVRSRLTTASRSTEDLAAQLEEEMELFLQEYPDTDLDAELAE